jgi:hypothetical protein|nr:hypothetical protein [uncultured Oscillibacter sp.]
MRNTGIEYGSGERTPVVLPEMAQLLPPLTGEQLAALEADLLANGCYSPIIVNEDMTVIDGHNRLELCEKHGIPYKMAVFSFADMLEAKQWALDTQKGRRNLDKWELGKIALKLKPDLEARAKANQSAAGGDKSEQGALLVNSPKALLPVNTRKEMAQAVGIGEQTMGRVMQIDEHAPPAVKEALDNGELSINQGYNLTKQLQVVPEDQRDEAATQAIALAQAKKELRELDAAAEHRGKVARLFCKAFEHAVQLTPTEENVRLWVEGTRMRTDEIEDSVKEARELARVFAAIADILERMLPIEVGAEEETT